MLRLVPLAPTCVVLSDNSHLAVAANRVIRSPSTSSMCGGGSARVIRSGATVGAPPTPRSNGRGARAGGFAGPPSRTRTSALSSPATKRSRVGDETVGCGDESKDLQNEVDDCEETHQHREPGSNRDSPSKDRCNPQNGRCTERDQFDQQDQERRRCSLWGA